MLLPQPDSPTSPRISAPLIPTDTRSIARTYRAFPVPARSPDRAEKTLLSSTARERGALFFGVVISPTPGLKQRTWCPLPDGDLRGGDRRRTRGPPAGTRGGRGSPRPPRSPRRSWTSCRIASSGGPRP